MKKFGKNSLKILVAACLFLILDSFTTGVRAQSAGKQRLHGHRHAFMDKSPDAGVLSGSTQLDLSIGLPLRNQEALHSLLQQIYDPQSPQYHRYLTPEQFTAMFGPTPEDYQAVLDFAKAKGLEVTGIHSNRVLVDVRGSAAAIQTAFNVNLRNHRRPDSSLFYAPDVEPSVDLAVPLLHISGLENLIVPKPNAKTKAVNTTMGLTQSNIKPSAGTGPNGMYQGNDFRVAYAPGVSLTGAGQSVALLEFDGFFANDITLYKNAANLPNVPVQTVLVDGYDGSANADNLEVALDIDMAIAMAPGLNQVTVYEAPNIGGASHSNDMLNLMATTNQAKQISSSWTIAADATTDQILLQFAAQGQSFFNCSGDFGPFQGSLTSFNIQDHSNATIVGGTILTTDSNGAYVSETTWPSSTAGTSTDNPIPAYQQGIDMSLNGGSPVFRNMVDVSMIAQDVFIFFNNGSPTGVVGTSIAGPLWAGFLALANQQAVANGKPPVGFVNTGLYAITKGTSYHTDLHDIADGSSEGQFAAVAGYDLATGVGSPAGQSLINHLTGTTNGPSPTPTRTSTPGSPTATPTRTPTTLATSTSTATLTPTSGTSGNCAGLPTWTTVGMPVYNAGTTVVYSPNNTAYKALVTVFGQDAFSPPTSPTVWQPLFVCGTGATNTPTATLTRTSTATLTNTPPVTSTFTPTATRTRTPTATLTRTSTATLTNTPPVTSTFTPTATRTRTPTATFTSGMNTATFTPTRTPTVTSSPTKTFTPAPPTATLTVTLTPTVTATPTRTLTPAPPTATFTPTNTRTPTPTPTTGTGINCAGLPTWTSVGMPVYNAGTTVVYAPNHSAYKALVTVFGQDVYAPPNTPTVWQFLGVCQ